MRAEIIFIRRVCVKRYQHVRVFIPQYSLVNMCANVTAPIYRRKWLFPLLLLLLLATGTIPMRTTMIIISITMATFDNLNIIMHKKIAIAIAVAI